MFICNDAIKSRSRSFFNKKITSKSVSDYINEVRIEKAKKLLETSNASISEIVEQTGFSSSNYFYIYFKKTNGVTPNEYKQRIGMREADTGGG